MKIDSFSSNKIFCSTTYVLCDDRGVLVIDPWFYSDEMKCFLWNLKKVDAILLTHWHWDHIRDIDKITSDFPWAKVYVHNDDLSMLTDPYLNCSMYVWKWDIIIKSEIQTIKQWILKIWWYEIEVIHMPWHTDWSVMYYFIEDKILFTWDTVLWNSVWTTKIPKWDWNLLNESLQKFKNLKIDENTMTYSWHWDIMTYWEILKFNEFLS